MYHPDYDSRAGAGNEYRIHIHSYAQQQDISFSSHLQAKYYHIIGLFAIFSYLKNNSDPISVREK